MKVKGQVSVFSASNEYIEVWLKCKVDHYWLSLVRSHNLNLVLRTAGYPSRSRDSTHVHHTQANTVKDELSVGVWCMEDEHNVGRDCQPKHNAHLWVRATQEPCCPR